MDGGEVEDAAAEAATDATSLRDAPDAAIGPDTAPEDTAPSAIAVNGVVTDTLGNPIANQTVNVFDSESGIYNAVTNATGAFTMPSVVPPYTLSVSQPGATTTAFSYVGVTTATPKVVGANAPPPLGSSTFTLTIAVPSCGTPSCYVSVASSSSLGESFQTGSSVPGNGYMWPLTATYLSAGTAPFSATLNILVADEEYSHYWLTQIPGVELTPGGPTTVIGVVGVMPLPTAGTITVTTSAAPWLPSWAEPQTSVSLRYPGGAAQAQLGQVTSSVLSLAVPDILGATLSAGASFQAVDDAGTASQWTYAGTSGLPLTTTSAALTLEPLCAWVAPSTSGAALPTTSTLSWQVGTPSGVSMVTIVDGAGDSISVVTGGTTAPLSTLAKTGVIMPPGDYLLLLSQLGPSTGLNALLESPDGAMQVFDGVSGPMWESSAVVRVTLTP
jgi:hypothetical protein